MEKQKAKILDIILKQITFFCLYWGFYAIGWHYCTTIKMNGYCTIFYDSAIFVPLLSTVFYIAGAIAVQLNITSPSSKPSDKQS
ncbi:hypothetical protein [Fibrobacter sp. UWH3]|uniref:hypothetical protein n=1 Tax=Fibrobacter sp. UWH3 TaxID=1964353 RepID=UPI001114BA22|nr:hypothetical protein [Fibrobacter sp. UWH3]MCQ2099719.1 hypothetical protein [Fibrobacter sp.]